MRRNIVWDARHHAAPNGRVHLSSQVVHLDTHQPIYRRPRQRDAVTKLAFVVAVLTVIGLIWVLLAIGRAIGGGLS